MDGRRLSIRTGSLFLMSFLISGAVFCYAEGEPRWVTVTAFEEDIGGEYGSIAVDEEGTVHIASFQWTHDEDAGGVAVPFGNLLYSTNTEGNWSSTVLAEGAGMTPRIALDSAGKVHIVHTRLGIDLQDTLLDLLYTTNRSGSWITEAIQSGAVKGTDASIALDSYGHIHLCCSNEEGTGTPSGPSGGLRYITNSTGSWSWIDIDTDPEAGHDTDIVVDGAGSIHISYLHASQGLGYATDAGGSWTASIVDSSPNVGWNTSIDADCYGRIYISYSDPAPILDPPGLGLLKVASSGGEPWSIEVVDDEGTGYYTNVAVDSEGAVHVAYLQIDSSVGRLRAAVKRWGDWTIETAADPADPGHSTGLYASIAVDGFGRPHISHYDYTAKTLLYTTRAGWPRGDHLPYRETSTRLLCEKTPSGRIDPVSPEVVASDWGTPQPVESLNTPCPEDAIEVSADGSHLYFMFTRDVDANLCPASLLSYPNGCHVAMRRGGPTEFGNTTFYDLGRGIDASFDAELSFSSDGGTVYFHSLRATNTGYLKDPPTGDFLDIYSAPITEKGPGPAVNLGEPVNSPYPDGEHAIHPDDITLFFTSHRPAPYAGANIWISTKVNETWMEPVLAPQPFNSDGHDLQPAFADAGNTIYFVSDRDGGMVIYRSRLTPGGWGPAEAVMKGNVGEPSLTADGELLYFVHVLSDDEGQFDADIWVSERIR